MIKDDINPYTLPTINFVGGSTQKFSFNAFMENSDPFVLSGCDIRFSVTKFAERGVSPLITKAMSLSSDNVMNVTLDPQDTMTLSGKYIYQITITHRDGMTTEIPNQGIMYIAYNIDQRSEG